MSRSAAGNPGKPKAAFRYFTVRIKFRLGLCKLLYYFFWGGFRVYRV